MDLVGASDSELGADAACGSEVQASAAFAGCAATWHNPGRRGLDGLGIGGSAVDIEQIITTYGYPALFAGAFLEGETVVLIGGFLAHRGYLELPLVWLVAFTGSLLGDQLAFFGGRSFGQAWIRRRAKMRARAAKISRWIARYEVPVLIGFRFVYGFRLVTPFVLAAAGYRPWRFLVFNVIGAAVWAVGIPTLGYVFGSAIDVLIEDVKRYELHILVGIVIAASAYGLIAWLRRRGQERSATTGDDAC